MTKRFINWTAATVIMTAVAVIGCHDDHAHDHAPAAGAKADGHDHGHGHGHDHSHGGETRESLGLETVGPYEVVAVQMGKLTPGANLAFDVEILGQPKPQAVRFWIGAEAANTKVPPESEKENVYHVDLTVPATVSPDTRLWVEIDQSPGQTHHARFNMKEGS